MKLPYDPVEAIQLLSGVDNRMGALIHAVGPFDIDYRPTQDLFDALSQAIVYQQLSGKAAGTIYGRFKALFEPTGIPTPEDTLAILPDVLRSVGLSRAKATAILDLADKSVSGLIPSLELMHDMSNAEILSTLTKVKGIGPWTVQMLLIFRLGRPDVMPASDLGIRKGFSLVYGHTELPDPKDLLEHATRWQPYRSVASWYLWRALEIPDFAPGHVEDRWARER